MNPHQLRPIAAATPAPGTTPRAQFLHVEKYARRAPYGKAGGNDIWKVANEAERVDGFCPHVPRPSSPKLLFGRPPAECARLAERWAEQKFTPYTDRRTKTEKLRKYRRDQPCALVGVISAPPAFFSPPHWEQFKHRVVSWLKRKYGDDRLLSVIEHIDEPQQHLHFWVVPRPDEDFAAVHQGVRAADEMKAERATRHRRDAAYKSAMSALQQEFFKEVAEPFGLLRESVGGERLGQAQLAQVKFEQKRREQAEEKERVARAVASDLSERCLQLEAALRAARATSVALTQRMQALTAQPVVRAKPQTAVSPGPQPVVRVAPQPSRAAPTPFDDRRLPRRPKPM